MPGNVAICHCVRDQRLAVGDHRAPVGGRRRDARAEVAERDDREHREHDVAHREHDRLRDHVRQQVADDDAGVREAGRARREHVLEALLHEDLAAHDARVRDPADGRDRDDDRALARAEHEHEREHQHDEREGDDDVDEAHHDRVDEARRSSRPGSRAAVPMQNGQNTAKNADQQVDAAGVDEPREHVAAELVGAEPVRAARVRVGVQQILGVRVVARDQRRASARGR